MSELSFKNIDWELEAKRVALAFGVREQCEFLEKKAGQMSLCGRWEQRYVFIAPEIVLEAVYDSESRMFGVGTADNGSCVRIFWDGRKSEVVVDDYERGIIIRALLELGLLSPDIEAALGTTFSAHQKLEEMLAFEERLRENQRIGSWHNAKHIKIAFGLESEVEYKPSGPNMMILEAELPDDLWLRVEDFDQVSWFSLQKGERATVIGIDWYDQVIQQPTQFDFARQLAKGLMYLCWHFSEIEKALKVEISDSERLEWREEYKARNDL